MIERGDWSGAAGLQVQPTQFAYVDAITHFARALGRGALRRSRRRQGRHREAC